MSRTDQQILLTGCYRTGSEYLTLLLNNHPQIAATMYVLNYMRYCYQRYDPIVDQENYYALIFDTAHRARQRWGRKIEAHKILDKCDEAEEITYAYLYNLLMENLFVEARTTAWAEKIQLVWTNIPDFLEMFPGGKVIHLFRDPRNVLASFKKFTYAPEPAYLGAVFNCLDSMQKGLQYKDNYPDNYLQVRQEDLLQEPKQELIRIFEFLEVSHDHELLTQENWTHPDGTPWEHNSAFLAEDDPEFDPQTAINRWKDNLTSWEVGLCETVIDDLMDKYGYSKSTPSVSWKKMVTPLLKDEKLEQYFKKWLKTGNGVEEYPTDPLKSANWEENN